MLRTTNSTAVVQCSSITRQKGGRKFSFPAARQLSRGEGPQHIYHKTLLKIVHTNSLAISEAIFHSKTAAALRTAVSWWWWTFKL